MKKPNHEDREIDAGVEMGYGSGSQTVGRDPQGGREGLERGAQHTFLQIKIKTALNQLEK
jgi:hypothetical protein